MNGPQRQRGVALMMAILIVALATMLATQIGFDSVLEQRRTATTLTAEHAFQIGLGAEAWAAHYLRQDFNRDQKLREDQRADHFGEDWAKPIPPLPVEGGQIEGQLQDLQGRFNLNNLAAENHDAWFEAFKRLLAALELEPKWAPILVDWLDRDVITRQDGAEDDVYTSLNPPYRAANTQIGSVSELLALPEFGIERYRKLQPYVSALPTDTQVNLCTAPGIVIDAIGGIDEFGRDPEGLARERQEKCFPTKEEFKPDDPDAAGMVQQTSTYFRLTALTTIGDMEFTLYSLLERQTQGGLVRTVSRSFSPE